MKSRRNTPATSLFATLMSAPRHLILNQNWPSTWRHTPQTKRACAMNVEQRLCHSLTWPNTRDGGTAIRQRQAKRVIGARSATRHFSRVTNWRYILGNFKCRAAVVKVFFCREGGGGGRRGHSGHSGPGHTAVKRGARAQCPPKLSLNKVLNFRKVLLLSPKLRQSLKS